MYEAVLRERQPRGRNSTLVAVAQQRQDRMIESRRRNFDSSLLCSVGMGRENPLDQITRALNDERLIRKRNTAAFGDESGDVRCLQEEFVEPGPLGEDL